MQRQVRICLFCAFCWDLTGAIVGAQQFSSAETKPSLTPTPIPLSEIASHAESTDLTLQGHVLEATARLQAVAPAFEQAQADVMRNLFVQDSPHLWRLGVEKWRAEIQASLIPRASAALLRAYIRREPTLFLLHGVIILLLFLLVYWLRRGVHKWTEEEPFESRRSKRRELGSD